MLAKIWNWSHKLLQTWFKILKCSYVSSITNFYKLDSPKNDNYIIGYTQIGYIMNAQFGQVSLMVLKEPQNHWNPFSWIHFAQCIFCENNASIYIIRWLCYFNVILMCKFSFVSMWLHYLRPIINYQHILQIFPVSSFYYQGKWWKLMQKHENPQTVQ